MQEDTRHETANGSRQITFAHDSMNPPQTSHMSRIPGLITSINTPNSLLVQSTISDDGINSILEQGPERFMLNRTGVPPKTVHE